MPFKCSCPWRPLSSWMWSRIWCMKSWMGMLQFAYITMLCILHSLPPGFQMLFKVLVITYKALLWMGPSYLKNYLSSMVYKIWQIKHVPVFKTMQADGTLFTLLWYLHCEIATLKWFEWSQPCCLLNRPWWLGFSPPRLTLDGISVLWVWWCYCVSLYWFPVYSHF